MLGHRQASLALLSHMAAAVEAARQLPAALVALAVVALVVALARMARQARRTPAAVEAVGTKAVAMVDPVVVERS